MEQAEPSRRPGGLLLTLILLPIIGYAGYRIYPPMVDLWNLAHEPANTSVIAPKAAPAVPATRSEAPETIPDAKPEPSAIQENSTPHVASPQIAVPTAPVNKSEPEEAPAAPNVQKSVASQKVAVSASMVAANVFESKLQLELQTLALTEKVKPWHSKRVDSLWTTDVA